MKTFYFLVLLLTFAFFLLTLPKPVSACSPPISGNLTIGSSCAFTGTVNGVDAGTGTSNTATITINSPSTLTINAAQTVAFGTSITINTGSSIAINAASGTQIRQTALWMTDADADNYPSSTTQIAQSTTPTNGRRRNVMTTVTSADCGDSSSVVQTNRTQYADGDGDGYTVSGSTVCMSNSTWGNSGCTTAGSSYAKNSSSTCLIISTLSGTDCYDSNANAKPGQTAYFTTNRGDGSFDYNCSGSATIPAYQVVQGPPCTCTSPGQTWNWSSSTCPGATGDVLTYNAAPAASSGTCGTAPSGCIIYGDDTAQLYGKDSYGCFALEGLRFSQIFSTYAAGTCYADSPPTPCR